MKAIRTHERTGISGLVLEEAPDPKPMFCEVLVRVAACGITHNELDWPIWTCRAGHQRTSVIPGHEVSGVVAALGFGTAGLAVGDEVFGLADQLRDGAARSASACCSSGAKASLIPAQIAPMRWAPWKATATSRSFGRQAATRSPGLTPSRHMAPAAADAARSSPA